MGSMQYEPVFGNLPDEVVEHILFHSVGVPYDIFCSPLQQFGNYDLADVSSSAVIEVCRRWLRIGTPLLYETVVLRSKAQVLALRAALDGNPALCKYIKKMRVEESYGMAIADVMQMCSEITDVWVSLRLQPKRMETGKGLHKGLKFLNPERIILWDYPMPKSYSRSGPFLRIPLIEALKGIFPRWKRLDTIRYLTVPGRLDQWAETLFTDLHESCLRLKYIYFAECHFSTNPSLLSDLAKVKTLQKIWILEGDDSNSQSTLGLSESTSEQHKGILKKVAIYPPCSSPPPTRRALQAVEPPRSPRLNLAPLRAAAPFKQMYILVNILRHWPGLPDLQSSDDTGLWQGPAFRTLSQVSRGFREVTLPCLYSDIDLETPSQCSALAEILETNPRYGEYIRHIRGDISTLLQYPEFPAILRMAPNLVSLQKGPDSPVYRGVTCDDLSVISILTGNRLRMLDVRIVDTLWPVSLIDWASLSVSLRGLRHLTSLVWTCEESDDPTTSDYTTYADVLPRLKHLEYASSSGNLMRFLTCLELPDLTDVEITKAPDSRASTRHKFLKTHGCKLNYLALPFKAFIPGLFTELCPELFAFELDVAGKASVPNTVAEIFNEAKWNNFMEDLYISTSEERNWWERELRFLESVDFSGFECLQSIHLQTYEWPTEQCAITKSLMVRLAEKWWLERHVRTVDRNGTAWKPRLKAPTSTRRVAGKKQLATLT